MASWTVQSGSETFKRPTKKVMRRQRAERGPRMFEPAELRQIIDTADVQLRAMILLGVNCGFGNHDVATLPIESCGPGRLDRLPASQDGH